MKLKKSGIFTKILIVILIIYLGSALMTMYGKISNAQKENRELQKLVTEKEAKNAETRHALENSEDESVIEDIARNKLNLIMPDEKVYYAG